MSRRVCICGSMAFIDEMEELADVLRKTGYDVDTPVREEQSLNWEVLADEQAVKLKRSFIDGHLDKIRQSDLVLVANYPKNGVEGYVGANSLMEAAFAYALGVPVAYLNEIGEQPCRLEAQSTARLIVGEDLGALLPVTAHTLADEQC